MPDDNNTGDMNDLDAAQLERLLERATQLPREIMPATDAWPTIHQRIEASRVREIVAGPGVKVERSRGRTLWQSHSLAWAAAAVLLVALTAVLFRNNRNMDAELIATGTSSTGTTALTVAAANTPGVSASMARVFARYDAAASDLANALDDRKPRLDPSTVAVLDSCLRKIDDAISEARAALANDPNNAIVTGLLTATYLQKLDLLRRAAELPLRNL